MPPGKMRRRTFSRKWQCDPDLQEWVQEAEGDSSKAYCKYCNSLLHPHRKVLLEHAETKKHKLNVQRVSRGEEVRPINRFFSNSDHLKSVQKKNELWLVCFIIEHCSIGEIDHLGELLSSVESSGSGFKDLSILHSRCTALIVNVIAPALHKGLVQDIGDGYFSLLIGERIDISSQICFTVIIRYASKSMKKIVCTFYKILNIINFDAISLTSALCNVLSQDGLNLQRCIGLGTNATNIMVGTPHSLYTQLKKMVPHLQLIKCMCYSLNLVGSKASEVIPKQIEFLVREIYTWFSYTSKRRDAYRQIFKTPENELPIKLIQPASTRWLSRGDCISKIIDQWDVLKLYFKMAYDSENCYTAKILFDLMNNTANKLYLTFLKLNIGELNATNHLFQLDVSSPTWMLNDLVHYYKSILQKLVVPAHFSRLSNVSDLVSFKFKNYLMPTTAISFGYDFELEGQKLNVNQVLDVKENCKLMLVKIAEELNSHIPPNMKMLEKIEILHPDRALQNMKSPIIPLALEFKNICKDVQETEREWNDIVHEEWINKMDESSFWFEVADLENFDGEQKYSHISELALSLLTLPLSNASVESVFSAMNELRNKIKDKLQLNTVNSILQVKFNLQRTGKDCRTFQPTREMLDKFDATMYEISVSALLD